MNVTATDRPCTDIRGSDDVREWKERKGKGSLGVVQRQGDK